MSITFSADEDCFAGWLRAYLDRHGLEAPAREAVVKFVEFVRVDLAADPAVGWAGGERAAIRASGRRLRLEGPAASPQEMLQRAAVAVGSGRSPSSSIVWHAAEPIVGGRRPT